MSSAINLDIMPLPMCLVANTDEGLVVQEDTVRILSKIKNPIVVVAIVGIYRTGKSFLMNRLMERNNGFALGATTESKTKGIWAWCRKHPKEPSWYLLLLDTEGLGDIEKDDDDNDNWIFALSVLLSCTLVYNWQSSLQSDAMGKLHYVTSLTDLIKSKSKPDAEEEDDEEFVKFFPNFVWVLRDFILKLEKDGQPITADQYLRNALKTKSGIGKKVNDYNLPRECIEKYFREKKCFVLKRPVDDDALFSVLDTLPDEMLQQDFLREVQHFCEYIFASATPKSIKGKQLNGSKICQLLKTFVQTIQSGNIVCMENAVKRMTDIANAEAVKSAVAHYKDKMEKSVQLPASLDELTKKHKASFDEALNIFISESMPVKNEQHKKEVEKTDTSHNVSGDTQQENDPYKECKDRLEKEFENKCQENKTASTNFCSKLLDDLSKDLDENVADGLYSKPGGNKNYENDKEKVIKSYQDTRRKGIMAEATLEERQKSWKSREAVILKSDTALSQADIKAAEERRRYENEKQQTLAAQERIAQQDQIIKVKEEDIKTTKAMMEQTLKEQKEKWIEDLEKLKKEKEEEKRIAVEEGSRKVAAEKEQIIARLEKDIEEAKQQPVSIQNEQPVYQRVIQGICSGVVEGMLNYASSRRSKP